MGGRRQAGSEVARKVRVTLASVRRCRPAGCSGRNRDRKKKGGDAVFAALTLHVARTAPSAAPAITEEVSAVPILPMASPGRVCACSRGSLIPSTPSHRWVAALSAKLAALLPRASGFGGFQGSSSKMNEGGIGAPKPRRRERGMRQKRLHLRGQKEGEGHSKQG